MRATVAALHATFQSSPLKVESAFHELGDLLQKELAPTLTPVQAQLDEGAAAVRDALLRLLACALATCSNHKEQPQVRSSALQCTLI